MPVAVVTDSTAYFPAELSGTYDLTVVPLTVVINGQEGLEGLEISPAEVAKGLRARYDDLIDRLSFYMPYDGARDALPEVLSALKA